MLSAFFDDSGNINDGDAFVIAGYVSTVEKWATFSDEWQSELDEEPSLPYFKMRHANSRAYPFNKMSRDEADARILEFVKIINRHALMGVVCTFCPDDFKQIIIGRVPEGMDDPYFFLFRNVISQVILAQRRLHAREKTDFYFDIQHKHPAQIKSAYDLVRFTSPPEMKEVMGDEANFRDDTDVLPLQAADLLAWQFRRYGDQCFREGRGVELPDVLERLHEIPLDRQVYSARDFVQIVAGLNYIAEAAKNLTVEQSIVAINRIWAAFPPKLN